MATRPLPSTARYSRRDRVRDELRARGFVSYRELAAIGIPMPVAHVESLRGEGFVIEDDLARRDEAGRPDRGWRLVKDPWSMEPETFRFESTVPAFCPTGDATA